MQERQARADNAGSPRLLTTQQVEDALRVDQSTIYRMAADGRLPAVKVGRQWRFPADAVAALLGTPQTGHQQHAAALESEAVREHETLEPTRVQPALEVAASMLGVMMVATDMQGEPVGPVVNPCPWFVEHAEDEQTVTACVEEWRALADDLDFTPRFQSGSLGFDCARIFVRSGSRLIGMVLAGGIAPEGDDTPGFYQLDATRRQAVLDALPKVSAALSSSAPTRPLGDRASADLPDPSRRRSA